MEIKTEGQTIYNVEIEKEIKKSYIEYAMSVIVGRALPDVRDGLKPVHRRILYSMYEDKLTNDKPFRKSATTVGNVLGHYHPHGDAAVYDTMVRMAQPFSLRYPLVEGHGNFGNVDGDGAAAYRYTEARMSKIASEMLSDLDKEVVDFVPNFDNKGKEPVVLPCRFPNLLVNGSIGIAVGMATNIPPHNLGEVIDGTVHLIDNPKAPIQELIEYIKGPDFPTGATIYGTSGIYEAYMTGRGKVLVRANHKFEEHGNKTSIIFDQIPYQVNKSALVASIAELVKDKKIDGISDLRDESGRNGMRIVIELKRDANPQVVLNLLYKYSQLQDTFAINMLALVDNEPKTLNLKQMLQYYIKHQEDVVTRRIKYDLEKAKARLHILEALKTAIDNIDEVIRIIRSKRTVPEAKAALIDAFGFTDVQGQAIVDMPLGRLAGLEIEKIIAEMNEKIALIEKLEGILADESGIFAIIKDELLEIKRIYGDERRTAIETATDDIIYEDLIERTNCVVAITETGYIKRMSVDVYQAQNRGGKGITAMTTKDEDAVRDIFVSGSHNYLFMFTDKGKLFIKKTYEIPEASRTAKGTNIVNILKLEQDEHVTAFISVGKLNTDEYLVMVTRQGKIKRCRLNLFKRIKKNGIRAIDLRDGDELLFVSKTDGKAQILMATSAGRGIRFNEEAARIMGRQAAGVRGIRLGEGESVVGACVFVRTEDGAVSRDLLSITEKGFGKRTALESFPLRARGGKGVICHKLTEKTGKLAGIAAVEGDDEIMLIADNGMMIRTKVAQIRVMGRSTAGVIVMRLTGEGETVVGLRKIKNDDEIDKENIEKASVSDSEDSADEIELLEDDGSEDDNDIIDETDDNDIIDETDENDLIDETDENDEVDDADETDEDDTES